MGIKILAILTIKKFMGRIKILVFACILTFTISCSQQKRYVTYEVKKGETMRDIANRLDIKTKDLLRLNPDVGRRPDAKTLIVIPNPKLNKKTTGDDSNVAIKPADEDIIIETPMDSIATIDSLKVVKIAYEYTTHTVEAKETVYALTKKYTISKKELLRLNPEFPDLKDNKLSIGQVLKVKAIEIKTFISLEEDLKNHVTHTVQPKETVYSLTRFYNISKEDLIRLNPEFPEIKENVIKFDQVLRIRTIEERKDTDSAKMYLDTIAENNAIKLAILLPFKAKEYDSLSTKTVFKNNPLVNMVTDFYMGAEIAIDSLKQQGVNIDVTVFDTGNRDENISTLLDEDQLDDMDVVIGPFYSNKAELVASKLRSPVVFPHFSKNQSDFSSSKLVKAEPDIDTHISFLATYLKDNYNGETIFVVGDGKPYSDHQIKNIVSSLQKHDSINKITILKPEEGYIKKERFTDEMKPKSHCWMIMTSDDKVVVADALNSMVVLPEDVTAQMFSITKNDTYDDVDNNKLARLEFGYVTNNFIDNDAIETKVFNRKYKVKNFAFPSEYSNKGFDVTYDVLMRLASGERLASTFDSGISFRLESKFDYRKKLFGSTSNNGLFIVKYNKDLSLERLK